MDKFEMVATTFMGLEKTLAQEILTLGGENIEILKRAVKFTGDDRLMYTANICLRTGLRVLVPLYDFEAVNEDELYDEVKRFQWEKIMKLEQTFAIDATISGSTFTHSKYVALKVKDAIVDRFRDKFGKRPDVGKENPDILLNVHINNENVTISLDSSGTSLDKRGYRKNANEAPINEALAAGIILISEWSAETPFYDPMAGSGTFSIEAAMIGTNTPPGLNRKFTFENWLDFDLPLFKEVWETLQKNIKKVDLQIFTSDLLTSNTKLIAENAKNAGMDEHIKISQEDFFESKPKTETGLIILNPPYNERMKIDNPEEFYAAIGDCFKKNYAGFNAWIISSDHASLKRVGLRAEQKTDLMNGGLEARFVFG
jgi:putative N6-adenine-specific DNA methylase